MSRFEVYFTCECGADHQCSFNNSNFLDDVCWKCGRTKHSFKETVKRWNSDSVRLWNPFTWRKNCYWEYPQHNSALEQTK